MKRLLIAAIAAGAIFLLPACGDEPDNRPDGGPGQTDGGTDPLPDGGNGGPDGGPDPEPATFPEFVIGLVTQPGSDADSAAPVALPTTDQAADDNSDGVFDSLF